LWAVDPTFLKRYRDIGGEYFTKAKFWSKHQVTVCQAKYDCQYLYDILVTSNRDKDHKSILRHKALGNPEHYNTGDPLSITLNIADPIKHMQSVPVETEPTVNSSNILDQYLTLPVCGVLKTGILIQCK
jgi:hypothetical protein